MDQMSLVVHQCVTHNSIFCSMKWLKKMQPPEWSASHLLIVIHSINFINYIWQWPFPFFSSNIYSIKQHYLTHLQFTSITKYELQTTLSTVLYFWVKNCTVKRPVLRNARFKITSNLSILRFDVSPTYLILLKLLVCLL